MVGAPVRRRQVAYLCHGGLSIRRACALMSVARSTLRYESRLVKRDAPVVAVMRELAAQYPRYGYRRIQVFLSRRGHVMSADRTHRLWRLNGLQVPRKRPRRRVAAHRPRPLAPTGANQVWAYDFLFDACANGQQLKCLTVIDEYQGVFGDRCGRQHPIGSRDRGAVEAGKRSRSTEVPALRQRFGVHLSSDPALGDGGTDRHGLHQSRQALAERIERELQRQVSRRVSRHAVVQEPDRCEDSDRRVPAAVQRGSATLESRAADAGGVQAAAINNRPQRSRLQVFRSEESRQVTLLTASVSASGRCFSL
jgi:hypothetical protein